MKNNSTKSLVFSLLSVILTITDFALLVMCFNAFLSATKSCVLSTVFCVMIMVIELFISIEVCGMNIRDLIMTSNNHELFSERMEKYYVTNIFPLNGSLKLGILCILKFLSLV